MIAYTYLLKHVPTSTYYYGCRYAKGCHPKEFWSEYKTSSKYVKQLVETYGEDSFKYEIRKVFQDQDSCRKWEHKVLRRMNVVSREDFLNKTDNISISKESASKGILNRKASQKQKETISAIGKLNKDKKRSEQTRKKLSSALLNNKYKLGKKETEETRLKKSLSKLGKPSNAIGNKQPRCSCIVCKKSLTSSTIKQHNNYHHKD
jgi:hypothetical protein